MTQQDQFVYHFHQRRVGSFKIGGQQADYTPVFRLSIKLPEGFKKTSFIYLCAPQVVFAIDRSCSSAAFKDNFRFEDSRFNYMCLEEMDWKKWEN